MYKDSSFTRLKSMMVFEAAQTFFSNQSLDGNEIFDQIRDIFLRARGQKFSAFEKKRLRKFFNKIVNCTMLQNDHFFIKGRIDHEDVSIINTSKVIKVSIKFHFFKADRCRLQVISTDDLGSFDKKISRLQGLIILRRILNKGGYMGIKRTDAYWHDICREHGIVIY